MTHPTCLHELSSNTHSENQQASRTLLQSTFIRLGWNKRGQWKPHHHTWRHWTTTHLPTPTTPTPTTPTPTTPTPTTPTPTTPTPTTTRWSRPHLPNGSNLKINTIFFEWLYTTLYDMAHPSHNTQLNNTDILHNLSMVATLPCWNTTSKYTSPCDTKLYSH